MIASFSTQPGKGFFGVSALVIVACSITLATPAATLTVSNTNDSGPGSLRQAILDANSTNGLDTIVFQIPGSGVHTIAPATPLPAVTDPVVIDGTTQPGFSVLPLIELNGSGVANAGLRLLATGSCTIRSLAINRFGGDGITLGGSGTNFVLGNFIGTDPSGTTALGNAHEGINVLSPGNVVGGTNAADRNLISANTDAGVYVFFAGGNMLLGNLIGTGLVGTNSLGNLNDGVVLYNAPGNIIGGAATGARNIVSGNHASGIYIFGTGSTGNTAQGNYIGTDLSGILVVSNGADGVTVQGAANNTIGGPYANAGNVLSGNGQAGVFLDGPGVTGSVIQGNLIGLGASGTNAVGNRFAGVTMTAATNNLIGGASLGAGNVISGNKQEGLLIGTNSVGNVVAGNFVGVNATGLSALSNAFNGITIASANSNVIGGTSADTRNVISGNGSYGIQIVSGATENVVQGNYIGTDSSGLLALPNQLSGLRIESSSNTVGGAASEARNLISGNAQDGIWIITNAASGNVVQGNFIGTGIGGANRLKNGRIGVHISGAPANLIGGTIPGSGNLISANGDAGIYLIASAAVGNVIQGNLVGTDLTGTSPLGNTFEGIYLELSSSNTIGGNIPGAGNLISGGNTWGVLIRQHHSFCRQQRQHLRRRPHS